MLHLAPLLAFLAARVYGTLTGLQRREYLLDERAGQRLVVHLDSPATTTISALAPDGSPPLNGQTAEGASFDGVLPTTGRYTVRSVQLGDFAASGRTAAFTLSFAITG